MSQPNPQTPFDLEQVELKTDVQIHRDLEPQPRRKSSSGTWPVVILLGIIALAGSAAAGFYYTRFQNVRKELDQLRADIDHASENLTATSGSLEETREALSKSQTSLQRMRSELDSSKQAQDTLKKEKAQLDKELSSSKKALETAQAETKAANAKTVPLEKSVKDLTQTRADLQQQLKEKEAEFTAKLADLNTALETSQTQMTNQAQTYRQKEENLQAQIRKLQTEYQTLRNQSESESAAGLAIIRERAELKSENERLKLQLSESSKKLEQSQQRITALETTKLGDLVPYSDEVQPAEVRFRAPLPEGVKFPRGMDRVIVMTLINENGAVDKAFLLPGQEVEGLPARDIISAIYQWKFRAPQKGNIRVKLWQPVVFEP